MPAPVERILLLTHELTFRGSSILALRLAQGLMQQKAEVVVICTRQQSFDRTLTNNLRVVEVPGYSVTIWGRVVQRTLLQNLTSQPPDVIHVLGPKLLQQGISLARTLDRPLVLGLTDQSEASRISFPSQSTECKAITCVSDSVRSALPSRLEQLEQRVILPGVPLDVSTVRPAILPDGGVPVIGMAGPLEVIKGGSFFLRACHRVLEAGVPIRIVVTGSGPEEKNLRRLATSLELDPHVTFVDDGTAMSAYLSAIDVFCLPSLQQGFGVIMLEAMALGRPVIASGVGGFLSIVEDNKNGLIVPPSDSRALSERILELLKDPELARRIAIAGQNLVEDRFSIDRMVDEMSLLYSELTEAHTSAVATLPMSVEKDTVA